MTEAEGAKRAVELSTDAELYASEQSAKARKVLADTEAYATSAVAKAITEHGIEAAQYQVALKLVEALTALGTSNGSQIVIVPASAMDAFGDAFRSLKGVYNGYNGKHLVGLALRCNRAGGASWRC